MLVFLVSLFCLVSVTIGTLLFAFLIIKPLLLRLNQKVIGKKISPNTYYSINLSLIAITIIVSILIIGQIAIMVTGEPGNAISNLRLFDSTETVNIPATTITSSPSEICQKAPKKLKSTLTEIEIKNLLDRPNILSEEFRNSPYNPLKLKVCQVCLCNKYLSGSYSPEGLSYDDDHEQYSICDSMYYGAVCSMEEEKLWGEKINRPKAVD
jgi:hypothetical protein